MTERMKYHSNARDIPWPAFIFAGLALAILWGIGYYGFGIDSIPTAKQGTAEVILPVLAIVSAVGLLAALAFLSGAFAAMGLSDKSRALGLPEGSVRALIALLLLVFFVIVAIFLYRQARGPLITTYSGISQDDFEKIPPDQVIGFTVTTTVQAGKEVKVYAVQRKVLDDVATEASDRLAQQIFTAVSTLVASIAAFYFGSQSVAVARGVAAPLQPVIRAINPAVGEQGADIPEVTILGRNFGPPVTVKFVKGSEEMTFVDVPASTASILLKPLSIPKTKAKGNYDVIVVNADGGEDRLSGAFEVK